MGLIKGLFGWLGALVTPTTVQSVVDAYRETVTDNDAANTLTAQMYIAELQARTIPIVDALHKIGRQALAWGQLAFYAWCLQNGIEITAELVGGVSGVAGIYTLVKGRGR